MPKLQDHFASVRCLIEMKHDYNQKDKTDCQTPFTSAEQQTGLELEQQQERGQTRSQTDSADHGLIGNGRIS